MDMGVTMSVDVDVAVNMDGDPEKVMNMDNKDLMPWVFFNNEDWRRQSLPLARGLQSFPAWKKKERKISLN